MLRSNPVIRMASTPSSGWRRSVASRLSKAYSPSTGVSWLALRKQPSYTPSRRQTSSTAYAVYSFPPDGGRLGWGKKREVGVRSENEGEGVGDGRDGRGSAQECVSYPDKAGAAEYSTASRVGGRG